MAHTRPDFFPDFYPFRVVLAGKNVEVCPGVDDKNGPFSQIPASDLRMAGATDIEKELYAAKTK